MIGLGLSNLAKELNFTKDKGIGNFTRNKKRTCKYFRCIIKYKDIII